MPFDKISEEYKEIDGLIKIYGVGKVLSYMVDNVYRMKDGDSSDYLQQLHDDLKIALNNYEQRYGRT